MDSPPTQLPPDRATLVEAHMRARAALMKPRGAPVGICRICSTVVYTADTLVLTAGSPLHADCVDLSRGQQV